MFTRQNANVAEADQGERRRGRFSSMRNRALTHGENVAQEAQASLERHTRTSEFVDLVRRIIYHQGQERTSLAAAGAAFWIILSVFPAAITVVIVFGLFVDPSEIANSLAHLTAWAPGTAGQALVAQLQQVAATDRTTLSIGLLVSVAVTLWSASAAAYGLARSIQQSYLLPPQKYLLARARSFLAGIAGVASLACIAFVTTLTSRVDDKYSGGWQGAVVFCLEIVLGFALVMALMVGLYRYGIARKTGLKPLLPGAALSTFGVAAVVIGFDVYLSLWGNYSAIYGAAAGIAIALILAYLAMYVILIGAILNAQLSKAHLPDTDDVVPLAGDEVVTNPDHVDVQNT